MPTRPEVLDLTTSMPLRVLEPGESLFGADTTAVAVLVEGALQVEAGGAALSLITRPGAFLGEIGALLHVPRTASVTAVSRSSVRVIGDPEAFFAEHPELALELARQLAGRLHRLTAYLTDVRQQYADSDGHLGMVDQLLGRLASRPPVDLEPGSDRSPDY